MINFYLKIQKSYRHNPYHNYFHAIDVTNTGKYLLITISQKRIAIFYENKN